MEITLIWTFLAQATATLVFIALLTWRDSLPLVSWANLLFAFAWAGVAVYGAMAHEGYVAPLAVTLAGLSLWFAVRAYRLIEEYGTPALTRATRE